VRQYARPSHCHFRQVELPHTRVSLRDVETLLKSDRLARARYTLRAAEAFAA
jgi:hypothetical protein